MGRLSKKAYLHNIILYMSKVLITGGSQGIGLALAKQYAKEGNELILCARDHVRLSEARNEIQSQYHVRTQIISIDLSKPRAAEALYEKVQNQDIDILINNAGFGFTEESRKIDIEKEESMMQVNTVALMSLCKLYMNDFVKKGSGTIVNVASTGAFQPGPYIAAYYASKSFVLNYSKALAVEAKPYGVHVCCLCPGPVDTDFYMKSGGRKPRTIMSAEKTAEIAVKKIAESKTVIIPGFLNRLALILPESVRVRFVARSKYKNLIKKQNG